ncbi:hypothetical protein Taro_029803 [Colocasia esculenta]|uniref:Kinesin motor domain-containing protein n=1 Tax=Colocasia esculenta TaxID=4460 RepID=A0A843VS77_COLES|nr:hypothetical protein [Colocasia esculenta]
MTAPRTPSTPAFKIDRTPASTPCKGPKEEKIFVTVRVRPLSKKELAMKDQVAWECVDENTIVSKSPSQDRSNSSALYTFGTEFGFLKPSKSMIFFSVTLPSPFDSGSCLTKEKFAPFPDKVFGPACLTETVYEEGAKDVALSALTGINATIFAYGQTSSGKTFTMRGITENAVNDIYKHIRNTPERDFVIKISALEIYNEVVRDLLKPDLGPLRLLDDPEKGTVVEKLEEETAKDSQHLRQLIGICEGSERASQTNAEGTRLKEGCHINRSLLTLMTVIRKLSVGKRSGHIPYRDSKLTRILQVSLGGNARTAIICTMSPALTHVEQSRNTLSFATRAKEVTNNAQVNMVVSDKQLVKHLQKEVARLAAELRTPESSASSEALLMEKELQIRKMEMEMEELKRQRDQAQSQLDELRGKMNENQQLHSALFQAWNPFDSPRRAVKCLTFSGPSPLREARGTHMAGRARNTMRQSSTVPFMLVNEIRKLEHLQSQLGEEANRALEVLQKEVACHRQGNQDAAETIAKLQAEIKEMRTVRSSLCKEVDIGKMVENQNGGANLKEEITRLHSQGSTIASLEEKLENVQRSLDKLVLSLPNANQPSKNATKSPKGQSKKKKLLPLSLSNSANMGNLLIKSPCSPLATSRMVLENEIENKAPVDDMAVTHENLPSSEKATPNKSEDCGDVSSREGTPCNQRSSSVNMRKMQKMFQNAAEENIRNIKSYVTELKERVAKLQYQKQLLVCQVLELETNEGYKNAEDGDESMSELQNSPGAWHSMFKEQRQQILQLWDVCHVSIIHRTQFYLLFRGDPDDQIYMEVELRRLTWLQRHVLELGNATPAHNGDEPTVSLASSIRALKQEKEFLSKRLNSRLTEEEREVLYLKWQVPLEGKQRRLQLINKLWTDPNDMENIEESAHLVARLVGFCEGGGNIPKEMFELNFALPEAKRPWLLGESKIGEEGDDRDRVTQTAVAPVEDGPSQVKE